MLRFLAFLQVTPKFKKQLKVFGAISIGLTLGYWKGSVVNDLYENVNDSKLIPYETEDQINTMIDKEQKPAVIYYALTMNRDHSFYREMMFKYSNLYPNNAIWTMVSVKQKFQEVKGILDFHYPTRTLLEVRFPKSQVAVKAGDATQFIEVKEKAHRRQPYNYNVSEEGFKKFLEFNRIIEGSDPVKNVLNVTKNALFGRIEKKDQKK